MTSWAYLSHELQFPEYTTPKRLLTDEGDECRLFGESTPDTPGDKFTLADDDGHVYFWGYLYQDPTDPDDIWCDVFDWAAADSGCTVIAQGHQTTQYAPGDVPGDDFPIGTHAITDQVIS